MFAVKTLNAVVFGWSCEFLQIVAKLLIIKDRQLELTFSICHCGSQMLFLAVLIDGFVCRSFLEATVLSHLRINSKCVESWTQGLPNRYQCIPEQKKQKDAKGVKKLAVTLTSLTA